MKNGLFEGLLAEVVVHGRPANNAYLYPRLSKGIKLAFGTEWTPISRFVARMGNTDFLSPFISGVLLVSLRSVDWLRWVRIKDGRLGNSTVSLDSWLPAGSSTVASVWDS